jgi:hypothetical protein
VKKKQKKRSTPTIFEVGRALARTPFSHASNRPKSAWQTTSCPTTGRSTPSSRSTGDRTWRHSPSQEWPRPHRRKNDLYTYASKQRSRQAIEALLPREGGRGYHIQVWARPALAVRPGPCPYIISAAVERAGNGHSEGPVQTLYIALPPPVGGLPNRHRRGALVRESLSVLVQHGARQRCFQWASSR